MTDSNNNTIIDNMPSLADRAMLVRLTRKRLRTSLRDKSLEDSVRAQTGDQSITVSKHLFRDKNNPVRKMLRMADEVYKLHTDNSLPWVDRGPRLIPTSRYMDYMQTMRDAISKVDALKPQIINNWHQHVADDIRARGGNASAMDYPSAGEAEQMMAFDVQALPVPDANDFRVQVDDSTKEALRRALGEAEDLARRDVIQRMLEPLQRASEKLAVPIGKEGSIFRDSLVENVREGVRQARQLNIAEDPDLVAAIEHIEQTIEQDVANPQALRTVQGSREKAKASLDEIVSRLGAM